MEVAKPLPQSGGAAFFPALVPIPEGWFLMGCDSGQDNERPVHRVWVDDFLLAACQVTNADYARFLRDTRSLPPPFWNDPNFNNPEQPVVAVSWFEAVRYCDWLSEQTGRRFRLPTEAEWERAARGGRGSALFPWGDAPPESLQGYAGRWQTGPEPVGQANASEYGLYNMCDNVHEWCADWYAPGYYAVSPDRNPRGPETGDRRASRGGSWRHHIKISRCAARSSIPPEFQYADYGFRVACNGWFVLDFESGSTILGDGRTASNKPDKAAGTIQSPAGADRRAYCRRRRHHPGADSSRPAETARPAPAVCG